MVETETNPAAALARMRTGITERKSKRKRQAAIANLIRARAAWAAMRPEERKRK